MIEEKLFNIIQKFLTSTRYKATYELASYGSKAILVLLDIFNGTLKNKFEVPYVSNLEFLRCTLVTCKLIGQSEIKLSSNDLNNLTLAIQPHLENDLEFIWEEASQALLYLNSISEEEHKTFCKLKTQLHIQKINKNYVTLTGKKDEL